VVEGLYHEEENIDFLMELKDLIKKPDNGFEHDLILVTKESWWP
jgi:hypothetical protein